MIAPFGGFYASAIKRTYNLKDFDSVIPGHGGVMDRMDCQFITALFTSVYYNTFIRCAIVCFLGCLRASVVLMSACDSLVRSSPMPSVAMVVNIVSKLSLDEQYEVLQRLKEMLQG